MAVQLFIHKISTFVQLRALSGIFSLSSRVVTVPLTATKVSQYLCLQYRLKGKTNLLGLQ